MITKRSLMAFSRRFLSNKKVIQRHGPYLIDTSGLIYPEGSQPSSLILPTSMNERPRAEKDSLLFDLQELIKLRGPITVSEYMLHCLSHPLHGYYKKLNRNENDMFGKGGDFVTAPEVSQLFGEMIGLWSVYTWMQNLNSCDRVRIVEIGPGRGTLMNDFLKAAGNFKGFSDAVQKGGVRMVETSPLLRQKQSEKLGVRDDQVSLKLGQKVEIKWHSFFQDVQEEQEKDPCPLIVICQELFDALPIHQFQLNEGMKWSERLVDIDPVDAELPLRFVLSSGQTPASKLLPMETISNIEEELTKDDVIEISPVGAGLVQQISESIAKSSGAALVIDYGYASENQDSFTVLKTNTLRGIKDHKFVSPLESPGDVDLSADVNFDYLRLNAKKENVMTFGAITQGDFLLNMGIEHRASQLMHQAKNEEEENQIYDGMDRLVSSEEELDGGMGVSYKVLGILSSENSATSAMAGFESLE